INKTDAGGSMTQGRVPVARLPVVPAPENEHDVVVMRCPPPLVMPLRLIVNKNLILRPFPFLSTSDFVVLIEVHGFVLRVYDVRLKIEVLLLEFDVSSRHICL